MGTRPSLSAFRNPLITSITDGNAWTTNELALDAFIPNADPGRLPSIAGVPEDPLVQLMETTQ